MDAVALIEAFHAAVARHLGLYMAALGVAAVAAWLVALITRGAGCSPRP